MTTSVPPIRIQYNFLERPRSSVWFSQYRLITHTHTHTCGGRLGDHTNTPAKTLRAYTDANALSSTGAANAAMHAHIHAHTPFRTGGDARPQTPIHV